VAVVVIVVVARVEAECHYVFSLQGPGLRVQALVLSVSGLEFTRDEACRMQG